MRLVDEEVELEPLASGEPDGCRGRCRRLNFREAENEALAGARILLASGCHGGRHVFGVIEWPPRTNVAPRAA
jgi:hypothetical protein